LGWWVNTLIPSLAFVKEKPMKINDPPIMWMKNMKILKLWNTEPTPNHPHLIVLHLTLLPCS
jgi:hypothetical protein